jgi:hypothetical protein
MDSILSLAGDLASQYKPILANWQGSPVMMNTKIEDKYVAEMISNIEGLNYNDIDVSECDQGIIDINQFEKYGEYARIYGNNRKWFEFFEEDGIGFYDFGYFGETLKGWEQLDICFKNPMTIEDFVELYINRQVHNYFNMPINKKLEYKKYILYKLYNICTSYNLNDKDLSKEDCMILYYIYRTHADTKCCNFVNVFGYSFNLFAQKDLIDYINQTPYEYKRNGRLNLAITKYLYPNLLNVPYFSHCHYMKYDEKTMTIYEDKSISLKHMFKEKIKKLIPHNIKRSLKRTIYKNNNIKERNKLVELIIKTELKDYLDIYVDQNTFSNITDYLTFLGSCYMLINAMEK